MSKGSTIAATTDTGDVVVIAQTRHTDLTATAPAEPSGPDFAWLDPLTLTVEANVRTTTDLDPAFIGSIRQHGVLMPVLVVREADGTLRVRAGQRRTLGAIAADATTIPARIIAAGPGAERLVQQVIENDQRTGLSDTDRVNAYEQMHLDFGMSAAQIAGRLGASKREVTTALRTVTKTAGRQAVAAGLTIDQAAVIAAFDDPDTVERLTSIAQQTPARLAHEAQRERDALADARARARLVEDLTAAGVPVLDAAPSEDDQTARPLYRLRDADGGDLGAAAHATCPGHAAYVSTGGYLDNYQPVARYACTDWRANGHQVPTWELRRDQPAAADDEAAREAKRAERRRVIEGNKAWRSATTVRREWLATFAARKSAPKGAAALLGYVVTHRHDDLATAASGGHEMARTLLGLTGDRFAGRQAISDAIDAAPVGRQNMIILTLALAAIEDSTADQTWRTPFAHVARYLDALEAWGYTLAPIEQQAAGRTPAPEPADDEPTGDDEPTEGDPSDETGEDAEPLAA
ncbi:ParB/RepB/Spo0J family partition protein [Cellulomonas sp. Y8]|uniref:ParB/RepB/Spo0J family partition protein n=1 Tax=Cellulomonas sp. Y8 TaxID=2591145 RepID=UPI003D7129DD